MSDNKLALPTIDELVSEENKAYAQNALTVLLNQPPPAKWLKAHPFAKFKNEAGQMVALPYLPIDKIEFMLTKVFPEWWVEVKSVQTIANSVSVTVRVHVIDPITGKERWNDGCGAVPMQTEKGAGAMEWDKINSSAVQLAVPAAKSYAFKDAVEGFGRVFGRDITRNGTMDYTSLLRKDEEITVEDLQILYDFKKEALTVAERADAERIIKTVEKVSFKKLHKLLMGK